MLPGSEDASHAQSVADAELALQAQQVTGWTEELRRFLRAVERAVRRALTADPRAEAMLRQHPDELWAEQVIESSRMRELVETDLRDVYERRYLSAAEEVNRIINAEFGLSWGLPDSLARQVIAEGGRRLGLLDLTARAKKDMFSALLRGRMAGETGDELARRIVGSIGRGRFSSVEDRALTIARTETHHAQRFSSLQIYRENPTFTGLMIYDGMYGAPRSDAVCIERYGDVVSFEEGERLMNLEHPNGTLVLAPVAAPPRGT